MGHTPKYGFRDAFQDYLIPTIRKRYNLRATGEKHALYVYQVIEADGSEGEIFEMIQHGRLPLTTHPENSKPVRKSSQPQTL